MPLLRQLHDLNSVLIASGFIGRQGVIRLLVGLPNDIINPVVDSSMLIMLNHFSINPALHKDKFVLETVLENAILGLNMQGMERQGEQVQGYLDEIQAYLNLIKEERKELKENIEISVQTIQLKKEKATPPDIKQKDRPTIFLLYSGADTKYIRSFKGHAYSISERVELFDMQTDVNATNINEQSIEQQWQNKIRETDILLVFISVNLFMYPKTEYNFFLENASKAPIMVPILLRSIDLDNNIAGLVSYPKEPGHSKFISEWSNEDAAFVNIIKGIKRILRNNFGQDY